MLSINTNITALIAQQNLLRSQSALKISMQRLATGLRINSADDDPAGLAIANRMSAQITGMAQAQRNTNDGISLVQVAESGMGQINDNLQRIRQLTVQAINGTNSQSDLDSIQAEITQRLAEVDRLSSQTHFNGIHLLGKDQALRIQVGANDGDTIAVKLSKIDTGTLGLGKFNVNGDTAATRDDVLDTVQEGGTVTTHAGGTSTLWTRLDGGRYTRNAGAPDAGNTIGVDALRTKTDQSDADVSMDAGNGHAYVLAIDTGVVTEGGKRVYANRDGALAVEPESILSEGPLQALDQALGQIDRARSHLGAMQNRFESVIDGLGTSIVNLSASRSRIQDADYAHEASNMIRAQIRQQVGIAMLAQANQIPSMILSLLRQSLG